MGPLLKVSMPIHETIFKEYKIIVDQISRNTYVLSKTNNSHLSKTQPIKVSSPSLYLFRNCLSASITQFGGTVTRSNLE